MRTRVPIAALPVTLAVLLMAVGCSKKEPESADQAPAPAPQAVPAPVETPATTPGQEATAEAPATAATTAAAGSDAGANVYKTYCVSCHGTTGKGDGPAAASLNPKPADFAAGAFKYDANGNGAKGEVDDIKAIARDGAAKHGGSPLMAPWPMLSEDQLQAVAEYVKSLHSG